jgi:transcriptional regulator with XRE-family HTH domain
MSNPETANLRNLRDLRRAKGLTQTALADQAGLRASTISDLESGKTSAPHPGTLRKLAVALGVSVEQVFESVAACPQPTGEADR